MSSIVQLADYKPEWAKRHGKRQAANVSAQFIRIILPYDDESIPHSFTFSYLHHLDEMI